MPITKRHSVSASAKSHFRPKSTCRSTVCTLSTSYSHLSLPERTSTSLPAMPTHFEAKARAEKLEKWMLRSSMPGVQSWSSTSDESRPSSALSTAGTVRNGRNDRLGKPTKTSMLRSKTCPARVIDYKEQIHKQKVFDFQCKVLSASISSQTLPNGENFHGFLLGARYNSAYTLDSHSRERYGVHVLKRNTGKLFVNRVQKPPSAKVYGNRSAIGSHNNEHELIVDHSINTLSEPRLQQVNNIENADSSGSIDRQLDEVFGPDEEGSSSDTTVISINSEGSTDCTQVLPSLDGSPLINRSSQHNAHEDISQLSLLHSDTQSEENEQDFISHEAQELTQEILKECQESTSSLSNHLNANVQVDALMDKADSYSAVQCSETKSTENNALKLTIDDTSQCSGKSSISINLACHRPVSAPFDRKSSPTQMLDKRPKSARTDLKHSQNKTASSIVIDMSSFLQTVKMEDNPNV